MVELLHNSLPEIRKLWGTIIGIESPTPEQFSDECLRLQLNLHIWSRVIVLQYRHYDSQKGIPIEQAEKLMKASELAKVNPVNWDQVALTLVAEPHESLNDFLERQDIEDQFKHDDFITTDAPNHEPIREEQARPVDRNVVNHQPIEVDWQPFRPQDSETTSRDGLTARRPNVFQDGWKSIFRLEVPDLAFNQALLAVSARAKLGGQSKFLIRSLEDKFFDKNYFKYLNGHMNKNLDISVFQSEVAMAVAQQLIDWKKISLDPQGTKNFAIKIALRDVAMEKLTQEISAGRLLFLQVSAQLLKVTRFQQAPTEQQRVQIIVSATGRLATIHQTLSSLPNISWAVYRPPEKKPEANPKAEKEEKTDQAKKDPPKDPQPPKKGRPQSKKGKGKGPQKPKPQN